MVLRRNRATDVASDVWADNELDLRKPADVKIVEKWLSDAELVEEEFAEAAKPRKEKR